MRKRLLEKFLVVKQECHESVKKLQKKINKLKSASKAKDFKIKSLETEISNLKGRTKTNYKLFNEEIKGNVLEIDILKDKMKTSGENIGKVSKELDRIKRNYHKDERNIGKQKSPRESAAVTVSINANSLKSRMEDVQVENNTITKAKADDTTQEPVQIIKETYSICQRMDKQ